MPALDLPAQPSAPSLRLVRSREPFRILLACSMKPHDTSNQHQALRRAHAVAEAFEAECFLLRILSGAPARSARFPPPHPMQAMARLSRAHRAWQSTLHEFNAVFPGLSPEQVLLRQGHLLRETEQTALEIQADLIVVPREPVLPGRDVAWLASTTQTPVLVVSSEAAGQSIVAATDLRDERYPVLAQASAWSRLLARPLVCVHRLPHEPPDEAECALSATLSRCQIEAEPVTVWGAPATDAILEEARTHAADVMVVGARPRSWFERFTWRGIASRVIDEAPCSVLVIPMPAAS